MQPQLGHVTVDPNSHSLILASGAGFISTPLAIRKTEFVLVFQSYLKLLVLIDSKGCESFNKISQVHRNWLS